MALELIYTSARQGLKPGSVGFCTVAMSRNMSPSLAAALESLSGYRHLFAAGDAKYAENPVNFGHYLLPDRGRLWRVLARIGPAPADYTGRTNKLAHFIVLDSAEYAAGGPAWLLEQPRLMLETWTGEPRWLDQPPTIPKGNGGPGRCAAWERVTGDPGWAGELLSRFCDRPDDPVHLVCNPGTPVLDLFAEALALLPTESRWQIGFSTYFTGLLAAGAKCHWRGIIAGTAANAGAVDPKSVIDITRPLGRAPDGPHYQAARKGAMVDLAAPLMAEAAIGLVDPPGRATTGRRAGPVKPAPSGGRVYDLAPAAADEAGGGDYRAVGLVARRKRRWLWPAAAGAALLVVLVVAAVLVVRAWERGGPPQVAVGPEKTPQAKPAKPSPKPAKAAKPNVGKPAPAAGGAGKKAQAKPAKSPPKTAKAAKPKSGLTLAQLAARRKAKQAAIAKRKQAALARWKAAEGKMKQAVVVVRDWPIFAPPQAGGLGLPGGTAVKEKKNEVPGAKTFTVVFPPETKGKGGALSLVVAGGEKGQLVAGNRWYPAAKAGTLVVNWTLPAAAGLGSPLTETVAKIQIGSGNLRVSRATDHSNQNRSEREAAERMVVDVLVHGSKIVRFQFLPSGLFCWKRIEREAAEQMVVDVLVHVDKIERVQFLSAGQFSSLNRPKVIHLNTSTRAGTKIASSLKFSPSLQLVKEAMDPSSLTGAIADKGGKSFSLGLGPRAVPGRPPRKLSFSVASGQIRNNYKALEKKLQIRLSHWKSRVDSSNSAVDSEETALHAAEQTPPSGKAAKKKWNKLLGKKRKALTTALAAQRKAKTGENMVAAQQKKLEDIESITFRVELYPGGPVLERVAYKKGPANKLGVK